MDDLIENVQKSLNKLPEEVVVLLRSKSLLRSLVQRMVIDQACTGLQLPEAIIKQVMANFREKQDRKSVV